MNVDNALIWTVLGSWATLIVQSLLKREEKEQDRNYEIKKSIYINISKAMTQYLLDDNEPKVLERVHDILGEAYIVAPDHVIMGIKKIWEDKESPTKLKGSNIGDLILALRRDLLKVTHLTNDDHFILK